MICNNCECEHNGSYSSGRFCSVKCARGFSTKNKREQIGEKISLALKGRGNPKIILNCKNCKNDFEVCWTKRNQKFCSKQCSNLFQSGKSKLSGIFRKKGSGGLREGGGRTKSLIYVKLDGSYVKLNSQEIRLVKIFDLLKIDWIRNTKGFKYIDLDKSEHLFYPDFYLPKFNLYVEFKGWVTDKMIHKMNDSKIKNDFNLLVVYGDNKRYSKLGISIDMIEKSPNILEDEISACSVKVTTHL